MNDIGIPSPNSTSETRHKDCAAAANLTIVSPNGASTLIDLANDA
jgi:hypothetical protein